MENQVAVTSGIDLTILDTDQVIDGDLAWNIAMFIAEAEDDVRVAKGKFWNRCKRGTREEICDYMVAQGKKGWGYDNMTYYGMAVREITENFQEIDPKHYITHWQMLRNNGVDKENRPQWIQKAIDEKLAATPLIALVKEARTSRVKEVIEDRAKKGEFGPNVRTIEDFQNKKQAEEKERKQETRSQYFPKRTPSTEMSLSEACEFMGLSPLSWIRQETLDVLYRGLSKKWHPDTRDGNNGDAVKLNKAKEVLQKIVK